MHGLEEVSASQMRQTPSIVSIGLVGRKRLERLMGRRLSTQTTRKPRWVSPWNGTGAIRPVSNTI
jgi:hypothetical protein